MPAPDFGALRAALLATGTAPDVVERTVAELDDHYCDLVDAGRVAGTARDEAERDALATLGDLQLLAAAVNRRPELKSWAWRWPRVACVVYPVACVAVLPAVPFVAGARNAAELARWFGGIVLSAALTAGLFFVLQLSIAVG